MDGEFAPRRTLTRAAPGSRLPGMGPLLTLLIVANFAVAALAGVSVLRQRKEPMAMLAWLFAIVTLPFLGVAAYMLFGGSRVHRKARRRRRRLAQLIARFGEWAEQGLAAPQRQAAEALPADLAAVAQLGRRLVSVPVVGGNAVEVFNDANATFAALERAIRGARQHIHLEYYIWQPDQTGTAFRDLLIERARAGVRCRLLLDAVGCWSLRRSFIRPMLDAGVEVAFFLPLWPLRRRVSPHLRNHRKIVVIDGQDAFVGSQNIGDEYRGRLKRLSPWFDTHLHIRGPAALFLQETFVEDWCFATRQALEIDPHLPQPAVVGDSLVQILPTGPDQGADALMQIVFAAVATAQREIRLETPYFVPGPAFLAALEHACYRGVRVQIVIPTRTDAPLVLMAGRSFYAQLLAAGVEIFEYDHGVLHSKIITVDDRWCMVGSANMDVRSFRLNFEITALLYDAAISRGLSEWIGGHASAARRLRPRDVWQPGLLRQVAEGAARLFSPLL